MTVDTPPRESVSEPMTGGSVLWRRAVLVVALVLVAALVLAAVVAPEVAVNARGAKVLKLDFGWAPWLVPAFALASTACAAVVVGHLLVAAFLAPGRHRLRAARIAAAVWTVIVVARILSGAAEIYGIPVKQAVGVRSLWFFLTNVETGQALLVVLVLTVVVAVGSGFATSADGAAAGLVVAVVAVVPPVAVGHASTGTSHQVIVSALMLHAAAAVLWTGGLLALLLCSRLPTDVRTVAVRRFSTLALWCFTIVLATGLVGAAARFERWSDLVESRYGMVLATKTGALVLLAVLGWWHRRISLPGLAAGRPRIFARLASVEVVVMAVTMGLATGLARTPPPNDYGAVIFETPLTPVMRWIPEPVFLAAAVAAITGYLAAVRRLNAVGRQPGHRWSRWRTGSWIGGWVALTAAGTSQLTIADPGTAATVTLVQHALVALVAPALWLAAGPRRLARRAALDGIGPAIRLAELLDSRPGRLLAHPVTAFFTCPLAVYGLMLTTANDWSDRSHGAHLAVYTFAATAGVMLWVSMIGRPPSRSGGNGSLVVMTPAGAGAPAGQGRPPVPRPRQG